MDTETSEYEQSVKELTRKSHIEEITFHPNDEAMSIHFTNTDASVMNALRRVVISEVPTLAIETVRIEENTSPLTGEYISHRLGLVPLVSTNVDQFESYRTCPEIDCDKCTVKFRLDFINDKENDVNVTSNDLTSACTNPFHVFPIRHPSLADRPPSPSMQVEEAADHSIVIAKLARRQALKLECTAVKGIGKDHAKWSPVCCSVFRYTPVVYVNENVFGEMKPDLQARFGGVCPRKIINVDKASGRVRVEASDLGPCNYCNECIQFASINKVPDLVRVEDKPGTFDYYVESTGVMAPEKIVASAFNVIVDKLKGIKLALEPSSQPEIN